MPNIQSNKKHLRKSKKRQVYNRSIKSRVKTTGKKIEDLLNANKVDEAKTGLDYFYKIIDKAGVKGVMKKNSIARRKSKLAIKLNFLQKNAGGENK